MLSFFELPLGVLSLRDLYRAADRNSSSAHLPADHGGESIACTCTSLPRTSTSASKLTRCYVVSPLPLVQVYEGESVINRAFASPQTVDRGGGVHSGTWQSAGDAYQLCHEWRMCAPM